MDLNKIQEAASNAYQNQNPTLNREDNIRSLEAGLMIKKHVLIESLYGMGKIFVAKAAATKAGLTLFEMDLDTGMGGLPVPTEKSSETETQKKEAFILDSVERAKANAILVNAFPQEDITAFVNVANKLNLQLIVCVTHDKAPETGLKISMYENRDDLKAVVDVLPPLNTQDFNPKIPMPSAAVLARMRISFASDLDDSNKPKPK